MKIKSDPRHQKRRKIAKELFAQSFTKQKELSPLTKQILGKLVEIDPLIEKSAPAWPIEKINKIDLAILRLAIFELRQGREPLKVVIDEAIELAKDFGSEASPSFVNGVLGKIVEGNEENEK